MKKKRFLSLFCVALCAALGLALCACGESPEEPHMHVFGEWETTAKATCTTDGVLTRSCTCGAIETDSIPATGVHTYGVDNTCTSCGLRLAFTEGLAFDPIQNGEAYALVHVGSALTEQIIVPAYHEGKPVVALRGLLLKDGVATAHRVTALELPATVTEVDPRALAFCNELTTIKVAADNPVYHSAGNCLIKTAERLLVAGCKSSAIPADGSVIAIGSAAFCENSALEQLEIPAAVTLIYPRAFEGCSALRAVTLKNSEATSTPGDPNPVFNGWYVSEAVDTVSGTAVDATNAEGVASGLKDAYLALYWHRSLADDTARY